MKSLDGLVYHLQTANMGLVPLGIQLWQNNIGAAMKQIEFQIKNSQLILLIKEGFNANKIKIGFNKPAYSQVDLHGESYCIGTIGQINYDAEYQLVLKIYMGFVEMSSARIMTMVFQDERLLIKMDEIPSVAVTLQQLLGKEKNDFSEETKAIYHRLIQLAVPMIDGY